MSRASEIAAELRIKHDSSAVRSLGITEARSVIASHADDLWKLLVEYLKTSVQDFLAVAPIAQQAGLRVDEINSMLVILGTRQLPIVKLTLNYQPKQWVRGTISQTFTAFSLPANQSVGPIRFSVDLRGQACFTDGDRYMGAAQVGDELMELIGEFFRKAMDRPQILS